MMKTTTSKYQGFTLIEVLIALVILSIGLLGMAGIQIQGLRGATSSTLRSQATILANDFAERAHANFFAAPGNAQNVTYANVDTSVINCANPPATLCSVSPDTAAADLPAAGCNSSQMAAYDVFVFACGDLGNAGINNLAANAFATVSCDNAASGCPIGSQLTVNVNWQEVNPTDGNNVDKTVTMVFVP